MFAFELATFSFLIQRRRIVERPLDRPMEKDRNDPREEKYNDKLSENELQVVALAWVMTFLDMILDQSMSPSAGSVNRWNQMCQVDSIRIGCHGGPQWTGKEGHNGPSKESRRFQCQKNIHQKIHADPGEAKPSLRHVEETKCSNCFE